MRLVFAGTPAVALPSLRALLDSAHDVVAVLTRPDAAAGRGRRPMPSPVASAAASAGVAVLTPTRLRDPAFLDQLRALAPDCCPVVAYGALVPPTALAVPAHGWVNLHFSLLPAWRGAAPVQHAVLAGDEVTGATTFRLAEGLDTGPVYGVLTEPVLPTDTSGDLLDRLALAGARLLLATVDGIAEGRLAAVPQPSDGVTSSPKLTADDARIDWTAPAARVDRLVRACTPQPGAWTTFRGQRVKLGPVTPAPEGASSLPPGQLAPTRSVVLVGTATAPVALGDVQPPGKRRMPAADWVNGARPSPGERFD
ncbi:MAG: methionyl-tRNA formyltransferase [Acidothermales bacterium]|jgi:methionyl-tRNA formyltransferase|nr:methionyl-tRNA formyltransferase [Acidothermales bacterium]